MIARRGVLGLVAAAVVLGCAPRPAATGQEIGVATAATSDSVHGRVEQTGSQPHPDLVLVRSGGQLLLEGPLAGELTHLTGMDVTLWGSRQPPPPNRFVATVYRIDSVDGSPARVGIVLVGADGQLQLAGADTVRLTGAPAGFDKLAGAKVWVTGQPGPGGLAVAAYGVIREAGK